MYELIRPPSAPAAAPVLDADQQAVVDHPGGPLLVLAGPGTGKTTTIVEAVVDRIERRGVRPESVLVLTFSRRAAAELRRRIVARLDPAVAGPRVLTFHALCHALLRRFARPEPGSPVPRLLTAPEQDFRVRETLAGSRETRRAQWPDSLARAFDTRAFAVEVRTVLAKARQLGMDPEDLVAAGDAAGRADWQAVGQFFDEYLDVLDAEGVLDYAELVHRCRILLTDPVVAASVLDEVSCVFVDEYQDTDPSQVMLLAAIAAGADELVVVGDPDQSIYTFRGSQARGILDFPELFPGADGRPAPVQALSVTRRFGPGLLAATRGVVRRLGLPRPLPPDVLAAFREPTCAAAGGRVEVITCSSPGAEAEHIAELLRAAHLRDGVPWSQMAVLVRSGRRMIPVLGRALTAAGAPVEVAGDEIPLSAEPAVRPLLLALAVAARGGAPGVEEAQLLLTSPLAGLDSMATRRLGRALRAAERLELGGAALPRSSSELLAAAMSDPELLSELPGGGDVDAACRLAVLLRECARAVRGGATAEEVLWQLWSPSGWAERLAAQVSSPGDAGRRADRDLDAVCALFDLAGRSETASGLRGVTAFLAEVEGQQIPADTWREAEVRGTGVRLLTAHRAKGLEWELVVVAGVQEGAWPDVRRRGTLLEPDRLSPRGLAPPDPTAVRIAEERRLFYVACTRARSRLVVTAVDGTEGEGDQPSRFLAELGVPIQARPGRPRRPLSLSALVAELRSSAVDPELTPGLREQAALRLAQLADLTDPEGRAQVPAARPANWWGMLEPTAARDPITAAGTPVQLSGSQLASVLACPRQWFLSRKAAAESRRSAAASFGSVLHVLAEHGASGLDTEALAGHLEDVWGQLDFDANWLSAVERVEAEAALGRFAAWQEARSEHQLLGTEVRFDCEVELAGERVRLTGSADRLERDADGRLRIVDFKTGRTAPSSAEVALHDQLGLYQLAVAQGGFDRLAEPGARPGGAELVYLRLPDGQGEGSGLPKVFQQASIDDVPYPSGTEPGSAPTWVHQHVAEAAELIRTERFEARIGPACRYCPFRTSCPAQSAGQQVVL